MVFVSHRWWNPNESQPDDVQNSKYMIISRALEGLMQKYNKEPSEVVVWIVSWKGRCALIGISLRASTNLSSPSASFGSPPPLTLTLGP